MYIPSAHAETDPETLHAFMEAHPFAALVTAGPDGLFATHLPLVLDRDRGPHGTLVGHVARANPHHRLPLEGEALVIFTGPHAYVSPAWYASKAEHGRVVPTWNYAAVHAYGTLSVVEDPARLRAHLEALVARHEGEREEPWALSDAPAEYLDQLQRGIVGVEIAVTRLEGKWKMSQNRSAADIDGVVAGLSASDRPEDRQVAEMVAARRPAT
jgi:transcriptional regulator